MPKPESTLTRKILKHLNSLPNSRAIKIHGSHILSGEPDIIACINGRTYALEVKVNASTYGATKLQQAVLAKWQEAGAVAAVITSVQDVADLIK